MSLSDASPTPMPPNSYWVIRSTWLSRRPHQESAFVAAVSTLLLALGSLLYWSDLGGANKWMSASYAEVFSKGELWRLWTTIFAHGDAGHLASNSFLFFILGFFLYGYFGWRLFPLSALIWGGVSNAIALSTYDPEMRLIGASGVVYWMGGTWLVLYFFLSRQKNLIHRWLRSLGVALLLFMPAETFQANVSYRTHLIGFALGIAAGTLHYLWHRKKFRSAEVRELVVEDVDPGDELPPPDGFPAEHNGTPRND